MGRNQSFDEVFALNCKNVWNPITVLRMSGKVYFQPLVPSWWFRTSYHTLSRWPSYRLQIQGSSYILQENGFGFVHVFCSWKLCNTHTTKIRHPKSLYFKLWVFFINYIFVQQKCFLQLQNVIGDLTAALYCRIYGALICLYEKGTFW